jgi:hypothetical protein
MVKTYYGELYRGYATSVLAVPDLMELVQGYWDDLILLSVASETEKVEFVLLKKKKEDVGYGGELPYNIIQIAAKSLQYETEKDKINSVCGDICDLFENAPVEITAQANAMPERVPEKINEIPLSGFALSFGNFIFAQNNIAVKEFGIKGDLYRGSLYRQKQLDEFLNFAYNYLQQDTAVYVTLSYYPRKITLMLKGQKGPTDSVCMARLAGVVFPSTLKKKASSLKDDAGKVQEIQNYLFRLFRNSPVEFEAVNETDEKDIVIFENLFQLKDLSLESAAQEDEKKKNSIRWLK